jgi:methyl-accepting chemotaxis protein
MLHIFQLRLIHKIISIGLIGLAGLLAVGTIYQLGTWSADASRALARNARAISDLNNQLSMHMQEARRAEKDFSLRRDEAFSKRFAEIAAAVERDFAQLKPLVLSSNGLAEKLEAANRGFNNYVQEFTTVVQAEIKLGLDYKHGLYGSLYHAVHDIEGKLEGVDNSQLINGILMMRRREKDFMLRQNPKYVQEMKELAAEFSKALAASELAPSLKAEISQKLQRYQADFLAWVEGAQETARRNEVMSASFRNVEPVIVDVQKSVAQLYNSADSAETATRESVGRGILMAFGVSLLVVSAVSLLMGRSISKALSGMVGAMTRLASGDASVLVPSLGRRDELGEMANAVEVFKNNMIETERLRAEQSEIEQRQRQQRKAEMHRLADAFEETVGEIVQTVSSAAVQLEGSANALTVAATHSTQLATIVAAASEEASSNVHSVATASEELTTSVNEISRQIQQSSRVAIEAVGQAQETTGRVSELSRAAARIGDVVELITTIAAQTNLLALNATIEAARAGEAGRGFAVVASEVKALAEQTAKATGEIGQQITAIQDATQESAGAIKEIGETIARMSEISSTIAAAVEEQGAATEEISRNIQHAAKGTTEVSSNLAEVQKGASQTGSASAQVLSAAHSLSSDSTRLKIEVNNFLATVRAA